MELKTPNLSPKALSLNVPKLEVPSLGSLLDLKQVPDSTSRYRQGNTVPRKTTNIKAENWDQYFEYSFALATADKKGLATAAPGSIEGFSNNAYPLRLPPQAISVSTPFNTVLTATNGGVLEEHNGVVFRTIAIQGTTGIWPDRPTVKGAPEGGVLNVMSRIFPGAVAAGTGLVASVNKLVGNTTTEKEPLEGLALTETGYYQFWALHNWFVAYAEAKKKAKYSGIRLVFNSFKDNIGYVVTPISFDLRRDANDPMRYNYSISLRCWDVIDPVGGASTKIDGGPDIRQPGFIKMFLEKMRQGRNSLQKASGVLSGVQSDVNDVISVFNQSYLAAKDAVGLAADITDFRYLYSNNSGVIYAYNKNLFDQEIERLNSAPHEGTPFPAISINTLGTARLGGYNHRASAGAGSTRSAPPNAIVETILNNPQAAQSIPAAALSAPPSLQEAKQKQEDAVSKTTSKDARRAAEKLKRLGENAAAQLGLMDANYARVHGLPEPTSTDRTPTEDDIILMADIQEAQEALHSVLGSGAVFKETMPNPFSAANEALPDDSKLITPTSGIPVFVEKGATLESIAFRYFQDESYARYIAILNGLRPPYIDEVGYTKPISQASGRTLVAQDIPMLGLNQVVTISGSGRVPQRRRVLDIKDIGQGNYLVTVDGADNLDMFIGSSPTMTARLPGTVGSGDVILIPSGEEPDDTAFDRATPLADRLSHAEKVFKIDWALDPKTGDWAIDPSGDIQRSYGYENATQAIRIITETEEGELKNHPTFGLPAVIGQPGTGLTPEQIGDIVKAKVTADPRFSDAKLSTVVSGNAIRIQIDAKGAGSTGRVPVAFDLTT